MITTLTLDSMGTPVSWAPPRPGPGGRPRAASPSSVNLAEARSVRGIAPMDHPPTLGALFPKAEGQLTFDTKEPSWRDRMMGRLVGDPLRSERNL